MPFGTGAILYYRRQPELARPLYEIAAGLDTGSLASMTFSARSLNLLDGRDRIAAEIPDHIALQIPAGLRPTSDYFSLLHLIGEHKSAGGFSQMKARFSEPQAWRSALVGHRGWKGQTKTACALG